MSIKETLFELCNAVGVNTLTEAADIAYKKLSQFCDCERKNGLTVVGKMQGESDKTLMLEAHIDEVAMIVTAVDDEGFVTVSNCGGIDLRGLPSRAVTIHGRESVPAVFCATPPHLSSGEIEYDDISKIKIDTLLGAKAKEIISVGDMVTFSACAESLLGNRVASKSLDNRAGVTCLLELASRLSGKSLPMNVVFVFSDAEELGMRGAKTASFAVNPDEAIAIDVSFASAPDVSPSESGKLGNGAMIGIAPVLDKSISASLVEIAKENDIPYQCEVMGATTGTNADVISINREGVKTGLVSIPLRNMHTECEVVDLDDMASVCDILERYILSGGADV